MLLWAWVQALLASGWQLTVILLTVLSAVVMLVSLAKHCRLVERLLDPLLTFTIPLLFSSSLFFTCSDPGIAPVPTELPKTFVKLGNSSFKVIRENLTWSEANRRCEADGAHLASIRDLVTQAYLELQVFRAQQPMWIGLNSVQVLHRSEKGKIIALHFVEIFTQKCQDTFMGFLLCGTQKRMFRLLIAI